MCELVADNIGALESAFEKYRRGVANLFGAVADRRVSAPTLSLRYIVAPQARTPTMAPTGVTTAQRRPRRSAKT